MTCTTCSSEIGKNDNAASPKSAAMRQCWVCRGLRIRAERDCQAVDEEAAKMREETAA